MGHGDDVIASGMARGAAARGKRVAFGDGTRIRWGPYSEMIFRHNPNVARPGEERRHDLEWVPYYKGSRIYNRQVGDRWVWNEQFKVQPGEFFFQAGEEATPTLEPGFIFIEPHVKKGIGTSNKDWGFENYQAIVDRLPDVAFVQCDYGLALLRDVHAIKTATYRAALYVLRKAALAIVPEGGMHHAAAALGIPAIVLFGGWAHPGVLGYDGHANLTGGATQFCGSFKPCEHCRKHLREIAVDDVLRYV